MTDTQSQEAASLAEWLEGVSEAISARRAAALLRSPAARIAELERDGAELFGKVFSLGYELGKVEDERDALRAEIARMREPLSEKRIYELWPGECWAFAAESVEFARAIEATHGITKTGGGV